MSETVYIETSVVGYLTARPSNNLILMANLGITQEWWDTRREQFTLYISQMVLDEVSRGDAEMANRRLEILRDFPLLEVNQDVQNLAVQFLTKSNGKSRRISSRLFAISASPRETSSKTIWEM